MRTTAAVELSQHQVSLKRSYFRINARDGYQCLKQLFGVIPTVGFLPPVARYFGVVLLTKHAFPYFKIAGHARLAVRFPLHASE